MLEIRAYAFSPEKRKLFPYDQKIREEIHRIVFPVGLRSIGDRACFRCRRLVSVSLPESVQSIGAYAFSECSKLAEAVLPAGVEYIGNGAFYNCGSLKSVTIPDSVTFIGEEAFHNCPLERVSISAAVLEKTTSPELWRAADIPVEALCRIMKQCPKSCKAELETKILADDSLAAIRYFQAQGRLQEYAAAHRLDEDTLMDL